MLIKRPIPKYLAFTYISAVAFWLVAAIALLINHFFGSHQSSIDKTNGADVVVLFLGIVAVVLYVVGLISGLVSLLKLRKSRNLSSALLNITILFSYFVVFYLSVK